ncbi:MAG: hypothetical protein KA498_06555 [Neisseriaceae bacterium]|nr:hypothetical protein [Neisseriaceae bacterium]
MNDFEMLILVRHDLNLGVLFRPMGDVISFAWPKETKQRKGHPDPRSLRDCPQQNLLSQRRQECSISYKSVVDRHKLFACFIWLNRTYFGGSTGRYFT